MEAKNNMATPERKGRAQSVQEIRGLRQKVEEKLRHLPNVIGSMIGVKIKAGKATKKLGLTIFVERKIPRDQLRPKERIPRSITINGISMHIDVLEMRPLIPHAPIFQSPLCIASNLAQYGSGTVSSFCRSRNGVFGITCAHVVGANSTGLPVNIYSNDSGQYIVIGKILLTYLEKGSGTDVALFTLDHVELNNQATSASVITTADPDPGNVDEVQGNAYFSGNLTGTVKGIEVQVLDVFADICIEVTTSGGISEGDSGMLWKNKTGQAVAIHAYGVSKAGSQISASMLASRAAKLLDVDFLDAP
jgi:hypothetical protein